MASPTSVRIGVIGAGRWGPNLIRVFRATGRSRVVAVAESDAQRRTQVLARYPGIDGYADGLALLQREDLDAVVIATPTATHRGLAGLALARGLHVMVEKPMAASLAEAEELGRIAADAGRVLLVGHVFLFHEGVRTVKRLIDSGELGVVQYIQSVRTNLGPIRTDVSALWDLASHDVSIFHYWMNELPWRATGKGGSYVNRGMEDVIFATLEFPGGVLANLHATWLSPRKVRQITVVGDHRMLVFDDMNLAEPVRVFDKGVFPAPGLTTDTVPIVDTLSAFRSSIREGEVTAPDVAGNEPLQEEGEHFLDCILNGEKPRSGAAEGIAVVRVLEAVQRSLRADCAQQEIGWATIR